jgi:hypothetical protein
MSQPKIKVIAHRNSFVVEVFQEDRVLYTIPCINSCHFYAVLFLLKKQLLEGKKIESEILSLKKD